MSAFTLIDGVQRNAEYPTTFEIPTVEDKASIEPGDYVKVGFEREDGCGERMWVKVSTALGRSQFTGQLDNDPILFPPTDLKCGDTVAFGAEHVLGILKPQKEGA